MLFTCYFLLLLVVVSHCVWFIFYDVAGYLSYPWNRQGSGVILGLCRSMTVAINQFYKILYERSRFSPFLDNREASRASDLLGNFVTGYSRVSAFAFRNGLTLFNVLPKLHYLDHIRRWLRAPLPFHPNPILYSTPRDEDFIGRLSRISRRTHAVSCCMLTLQRYLIKARRAWRSRRHEVFIAAGAW